MISLDAFQDELEKIAVGMSIDKIRSAGKGIASSIASAPTQHGTAIKARLARMSSGPHQARMGDVMSKRLARADTLNRAGGSPFSPKGKAMLDRSKHLYDSVSALNTARQTIHNTAERKFGSQDMLKQPLNLMKG